jgi:hypothetical protein
MTLSLEWHERIQFAAGEKSLPNDGDLHGQTIPPRPVPYLPTIYLVGKDLPDAALGKLRYLGYGLFFPMERSISEGAK